MDKVWPGKMFILISIKVKFSLINSQQIWTNFNTFPCCSRVIFNLDAVDKGWRLLYRERYQSE